MRHCITVPLERHTDLSGSFQTEPYECGWAAEALFFVRIQQQRGQDARMSARVQVSADGIHWMDEGTGFRPLSGEGDYFVRVSHFGGWLRLAGQVEGPEAEMNVMIHLVLKS